MKSLVGHDAEIQQMEGYFHPKKPSSARRKVSVAHGPGGILSDPAEDIHQAQSVVADDSKS